MDSLIIGALLSQIHVSNLRIPQKWIYFISVVISVPLVMSIVVFGNSWFDKPLMETIGYSCIALCFACLIHVTLQERNFIAGICNTRFLRFCGKISFGLYVFHWPVLLIFGGKITNWGSFLFPGHLFVTQIVSIVLSIILSFVMSVISFRYFESYFLALKK